VAVFFAIPQQPPIITTFDVSGGWAKQRIEKSKTQSVEIILISLVFV
jgi:hypothetical protein